MNGYPQNDLGVAPFMEIFISMGIHLIAGSQLRAVHCSSGTRQIEGARTR